MKLFPLSLENQVWLIALVLTLSVTWYLSNNLYLRIHYNHQGVPIAGAETTASGKIEIEVMPVRFNFQHNDRSTSLDLYWKTGRVWSYGWVKKDWDKELMGKD